MKIKFLSAAMVITFATLFVSCDKNDCHSCHYDKNGEEIELGEKCGEELETLEANGYTDTTGNKYVVHCHAH
jgi:hypothetical protein